MKYQGIKNRISFPAASEFKGMHKGVCFPAVSEYGTNEYKSFRNNDNLIEVSRKEGQKHHEIISK